MSDSEVSSSFNSNFSDSLSVSDLTSESEQDVESLSYDYEDLEPVATEEERAEHQLEVQHEEEQQTMLQNRFEGNSEVSSWYV